MDSMASQISVCLPASAGRQRLGAGVGCHWGCMGSVHDLQATGKAVTMAGELWADELLPPPRVTDACKWAARLHSLQQKPSFRSKKKKKPHSI